MLDEEWVDIGTLSDQAKIWIEKNYMEKFKLDDLSEALHVSKGHLARTFKSETGMTPLSYHNYYRCIMANEMLKKPELSLSFIGNQVGFVTASHFAHVYKRTFGYAPSDFRRRALLKESGLI